MSLGRFVVRKARHRLQPRSVADLIAKQGVGQVVVFADRLKCAYEQAVAGGESVCAFQCNAQMARGWGLEGEPVVEMSTADALIQHTALQDAVFKLSLAANPVCVVDGGTVDVTAYKSFEDARVAAAKTPAFEES